MALRPLLIGGLVLLVRVLTFPRTPWDADELRFPFALMVGISIAASVVTAVAFAIAFKDELAALLFSFSAAALVHGASARLDAAAWMFVALALLVVQRPLLLGAFAGAAVACQPAMIFSVLALLFAARRPWALVAFAVVLAPFVAIPEDISVLTGLNPVRFVLHPWGSKWIALPLLVCVAAGVRPLLREWDEKTEILMWFTFVHVATGIALIDPADGVRFAVPSLLFTALVAARGLREVTRYSLLVARAVMIFSRPATRNESRATSHEQRIVLRVSWAGAAVLCALSVWYAYPILRDRVTRPSPPVEAARNIPKSVVVLHDRETAPFAKGLPLDAGLRRYVDSPSVPLLYFANGNAPNGRVFARDDADAYGKLTRNAYRRVSLIPIEERYAPLRGVFGIERNEAGESWRWLESEAELRAPKATVVELRLPASAAIESNHVRVNEARVRILRGETIAVRIQPADRILVRTTRTFPLQPPDTRRVAMQLLRVGRWGAGSQPAVQPAPRRLGAGGTAAEAAALP